MHFNEISRIGGMEKKGFGGIIGYGPSVTRPVLIA